MKHIWRKTQRLLAGVLSVAMVVSLFAGVPSLHAEAAQTSDTEVLLDENGQEYSVQGINDVGNLLAEEITAASEEQSAGTGYFVYHVEVTEKTAMVEYSALEDCTMVVAIYDEAGVQMLASGTTEILADESLATVTIDTETMPEYFMVKVFMVDSFNLKPLASEYSSPRYTQDMQALLNATVEDFDEERVLNLDDDKTTNFMVYGEDTILIAADEDTNVVTVAAEDSDVYTVENIDENLAALQVGDIVAIGSDENVTIIKVASIDIDGTTATITEAEVELEEVFDYVKVEEDADATDTVVNADTCEEGVTYVGEVSGETDVPEVVTANGDSSTTVEKGYYADGSLEVDYTDGMVDIVGTFEGGKKFEFEEPIVSNSAGNKSIKVSGDATIGLTAEVNVLMTKYAKLVEFYIGFQASANITIKGEIGKTADKIKIGTAEINIPTGTLLNISIEPKLVFKASAEISFSAGISGKLGFVYDTTAKEKVKPAGEAKMDFISMSIEGTIGVGVAIEPGIELVDDMIAEIGFSAEVMLQAEVSTTVSISLGTGGDEQHDCSVCFAGDLNVVPSVAPKVVFANKPINLGIEKSWKYVLGKAYFSADPDHPQFGFGECPYIDPELKDAVIHVVDKYGNAVSGATVVVSGETAAGEEYYAEYTTDSSGIVDHYIPIGDYVIEVTKQYYRKTKKNLKNWTDTRVIPDIRLYEYDQIIKEPVVVGDGTELTSFYSKSYIKKLVIENDDFSVTGYPFNNSEIENVVIKDGVTKIPENLFHGCTIRKISVPDSIVEIGEGAFSQATLPKNFKLGTGVQTIGDYAFDHCDGETAEFVFTEGMTLGQHVFYYADWGNVYVDSLTDVTLSIPFDQATLEAVYLSPEVTTIPEGMFSSATIGEIEIPDTITEIKTDAFSGTEVLYDFAMGSGVETYGAYAFYGAVLPEAFALGESVKTVGTNAFARLDGTISKLVVSEGMTIGESAFYEAQIKELVLNSENVSVASTFEKYTDNTDKSSFTMAVIEKVTISDEATGIPNYMFQGSEIKKITIPENITSIGIGAFYDTTLPEDFRLGDGVETIGSWAFRFVELPTGFEIKESVKTISQCAFEWCDGEIAKLVISEGMTLEVGAISSRVTIRELLLASGTDVTITVQNVDYGSALAGVTIKKVTISEEATNIPVRMFFGSTIEEIEIPDNITEIGGAAFNSATLPEGFELGAGVKTIGSSAFVGSNLEGVTIVINEGMTIEGSAFSGLPLKEVVLNSGVDVAVGNPFSEATIGTVSFSEEVSTIPSNLFYDSTIEAIEMPDSITEIGESAFGSTILPEDFELGAGVKTLGSYAFANSNWEVSEFVIDSGMTLESSVFTGLTIQKIILNSGAEVVATMPFNGTTIEAVSISGEADSIPAQLFRESTINAIVIPSNVTAIGDYAFYYTTLPSDFTVSDSVSVGSNAFTGSTYTYVAPETVETTTVQAPEAIVETVDVVELPEVLSENVMTAEVLERDNVAEATLATVASTETTNTSSFTDLRPNATYNFYAVKVNADFMTTEEILAADNLLYITQVTADENGTVTINYTPKEEYEDIVEFVTMMSQMDIANAEIVLENIFYDGNAHEVAPQVTYAGQVLTQYEDYEISGDYIVTETGVYSVTISGINDYCGEVTVNFRVVTEEPVTALALDKQTATLKEGESTSFAVSYTPASTFQTEVIWSTSDASVATVENGVVTAVSEGTATITVTSADNAEVSASCTVTVEAEEEPEPEPDVNPFSDINKGEWYYKYTKFAYENGLMNGKDKTEDGLVVFDPANTITRAEFVRILYNKENKPAVEYNDIFTDVPEGIWYTNAILWAYDKGIVAGKGEGIFDVNGEITRLEIAQILYKYAVYKGYDVTTKSAADLSSFADADTVVTWGQKAMKWATGYEIVTGKDTEGGKTIAPDGSAIRAEAATMMKKIMMAYEGVTE